MLSMWSRWICRQTPPLYLERHLRQSPADQQPSQPVLRAGEGPSCPNCLGLLACPPPPSGVPRADRSRLLGPGGGPLLSTDLLSWTPDVPGFCKVCGWPPGTDRGWPQPESPEGASASLALLTRFLVARRPRVPTFSVRPSRFSELKLLGDGRPPPPNQGSLARSLLNWVPPSCPNLRSPCARTLIRVPRCGALHIL